LHVYNKTKVQIAHNFHKIKFNITYKNLRKLSYIQGVVRHSDYDLGCAMYIDNNVSDEYAPTIFRGEI
jgi:hypothetical protein